MNRTTLSQRQSNIDQFAHRNEQVPLFGLHYILLPFRPDAGSTFDKAYQITSALLISLQVCILSGSEGKQQRCIGKLQSPFFVFFSTNRESVCRACSVLPITMCCSSCAACWCASFPIWWCHNWKPTANMTHRRPRKRVTLSSKTVGLHGFYSGLQNDVQDQRSECFVLIGHVPLNKYTYTQHNVLTTF